MQRSNFLAGIAVILLGLSVSAVEALGFVRDCPQCNELAQKIGNIKNCEDSLREACRISILCEQLAANPTASQKEREDAQKLLRCATILRRYSMYRESIEETEDFFDKFDAQKQTQQEYFDQYVEQHIKKGNLSSADDLLLKLRQSIVMRMNSPQSSTEEAGQAALWKTFVNGEEPTKPSPAEQKDKAMKTLNTLLGKAIK